MKQSVRFLIIVLTGFAFGLFIFLPINEMTSWFEYHLQSDSSMTGFVWNQMKKALTLRMPLKFAFYLVFGGIMGILSYFIMSLMRRRDNLILQLEKELEKNLGALIRKGEDEDLEFKSSFRYDYRQEKVNKALEMVIMKTLAGFMNTQGGSLLLGVADDGSVLGLEKDYQTLNRKDSDGFTQLVMSTVADKIGTPACRLLRILFHHQDGKEVCRIIVLPSPTPVYVREDNQSHFYIRTGSGTREMDVAEAIVFVKNKWS